MVLTSHDKLGDYRQQDWLLAGRVAAPYLCASRDAARRVTMMASPRAAKPTAGPEKADERTPRPEATKRLQER